jgi:hypothetical protein
MTAKLLCAYAECGNLVAGPEFAKRPSLPSFRAPTLTKYDPIRLTLTLKSNTTSNPLIPTRNRNENRNRNKNLCRSRQLLKAIHG